MSPLLSHTTALSLMREHWGDGAFRRSTRATLPPETLRREGLDILLDPATRSDATIHALVSRKEHARACDGMQAHLATRPFPAGGLVLPPPRAGGFHGLGPDARLCSPEVVFIQVAAALSLPELVQLGMELCGTYSVRPSDGSLVQHAPMTTPARLGFFVERCSWLRGSAAARRALAHIVANSASPMETILYLLLCLPIRLGGYGLPQVELNPQLIVPTRTRAITSKRTVFPDVYFRASKLSVEYESDKHHLTSEEYARDSHRRTVLSHMGIHVLTVSRAELFDAGLLDATAHAIAREIGHRLRRLDEGWRSRRRALRKILLNPYRPELTSDVEGISNAHLNRDLIETSYVADQWGNIITLEEARVLGINLPSTGEPIEAEQLEAQFLDSLD